MKLIDFEKLFENKLSRYMQENAGKYTAEQWEKLIPKLYQNFGDIYIKAAGDTPRGFFAKMSGEELAGYLESCVREGIPVSDFLVRELEKRDCPDALCALLEKENEELSLAALGAAGEGMRAGELCFSVLTGDFPPSVKDAAAEKLRSYPLESFWERAVSCYREEKGGEYLLELLSSGEVRDDRIFDVLMEALRSAGERTDVVAGLVARYGDERALETLLELIDREEIGFVAYRELLCAIEALGGHYEKKRDFSSDKDFLRIKENSEKETKK